ncbi:unnamed protein product [Ilex paraguariensis]|uniref:Uncharacterized protein n=1 Tax=Ilex paraguariensis TaxID=185542 RepID=A0ABC8RE47_9AQUA
MILTPFLSPPRRCSFNLSKEKPFVPWITLLLSPPRSHFFIPLLRIFSSDREGLNPLTMAKLHPLPVVILLSLFLVQRSLCADPLEISPSPSTDLAADSPPSPPPDAAGAPFTSPPAGDPFTSPPTSSPLVPPPSVLSPSPPANSTSKKTQTPALLQQIIRLRNLRLRHRLR